MNSHATIIGQKRAIKTLQHEFIEKQHTGSYLFEGPRSVGKHTAAQLMLKTLFCQTSQQQPCNQCSHCKKISRRSHPDLLEISPEKHVINIDRIREAIVHLQYPPLESPVRALIVDDADCMNRFAANALLKVLEEPPEKTLLILISSRPATLLPTILSRCKRIRFNPLSGKERASILGIPDEDAALLTHLGEESWENHEAVREKSNVIAQECDRLLKLLGEIYGKPGNSETLKTTSTALWKLASMLLENDATLPRRLALLQSMLRDLCFLKEGIHADTLLHSKAKNSLQTIASHFDQENILALLQRTDHTLNAIQRGYANRKIAVEHLLTGLEQALAKAQGGR